MKRMLLTTFALGGVLILSQIALAQTQKGNSRSPLFSSSIRSIFPPATPQEPQPERTAEASRPTLAETKRTAPQPTLAKPKRSNLAAAPAPGIDPFSLDPAPGQSRPRDRVATPKARTDAESLSPGKEQSRLAQNLPTLGSSDKEPPAPLQSLGQHNTPALVKPSEFATKSGPMPTFASTPAAPKAVARSNSSNNQTGMPELAPPIKLSSPKSSAPGNRPLASPTGPLSQSEKQLVSQDRPSPQTVKPSEPPRLLTPRHTQSGHPANGGPALNGFSNQSPPVSGDLKPADNTDGRGIPAEGRQFEGAQTPQLRLVKTAPPEVQVGKPALFRIEVENIGPTVAGQVEVRDEIPRGTRLLGTVPQALRGGRGELVWSLGQMKPGEKNVIQVKLVPTVEGEIGSMATVRFDAAASVRTRSTKPQLKIDLTGSDQVLIDNKASLKITLSNPGTGIATGVVIEEHVPPGLQHPAGAELEYEVGTLAPGQSRTLELKLDAIRPGTATNLLVARAEGIKEIRREWPIDVVAPELKLAMNGPKRRYLERPATYELAVSNPGTASARDVRLSAELPPGLKFVSANNNAHYDQKTRTVSWALAELPPNETGSVQVTTMPVAMGQQRVRFEGAADRAMAVKYEHPVEIDGIAAIRFELVDLEDPIEVGGETTYEIRVFNQGSKEATNLKVTAALPAGLKPIGAEGPGGLQGRLEGDTIVFEPLGQLAPKVETTYRIRVKGATPGDQRMSVQLTTNEIQTPVTKEESTRVFSD